LSARATWPSSLRRLARTISDSKGCPVRLRISEFVTCSDHVIFSMRRETDVIQRPDVRQKYRLMPRLLWTGHNNNILQVMTRYTSCTHMDRSPLLYVHVAWRASTTNQSGLMTLIFDLLTLKVVSESRVTWATIMPILVFLGLSVLELRLIYARDRQTSYRGQTSEESIA